MTMLPAGLNPHATHILTVPCDKCNGKGFISAFDHIDGGLCYGCDGECTMEVTIHPPEHGPWLPPAERKGKWVSLPSMPGALVCRSPWGGLMLETVSDRGVMHSHFGVRNGRVYVEGMCGGHVTMVCRAAGMPGTEWSDDDEVGPYMTWHAPEVTSRTMERFARMTLRAELQAAYKPI